MNKNFRHGSSEDCSKGRFWMAVWKRTALMVIVVALVIGFAGCSLDDLMTPFTGDIPFEQEQTKPTDIGAVDNTPTVPNDDAPLGNFGGIDPF